MGAATRSARLAATLAGLSIVSAGLAVVLVAVAQSRSSDPRLGSFVGGSTDSLTALTFSVVGLLIATRRPRNLVGWAFVVAGFALGFGNALIQYAYLALAPDTGLNLPAGRASLSIGAGNWTLLLISLFVLLLLFPQGTFPSSRWRWLTRVVVPLLLVVWLGLTLVPEFGDPPYDDVRNPFYLSFLGGNLFPILVLVVPCLVSVIAAAVNLLLRFWRSHGDEREQFKWFAASVLFFVVCFTLAAVDDSYSGGVIGVALTLALNTIPIAVGVAVFKYHLYDIDILINRALVYVPLTAALAGLYAALVGVFKTLVSGFTSSGNDASVAMTTIVIVAVLTPMKSQLQSFVDRYFKDTSVAPSQVLEKLSAQATSLAQSLAPEEFVRRSLGDVASAYGCAGATLRPASGLETRVGQQVGSEWIRVSFETREAGPGLLILNGPGTRRELTEADSKALAATGERLATLVSLIEQRRQSLHRADPASPSFPGSDEDGSIALSADLSP